MWTFTRNLSAALAAAGLLWGCGSGKDAGSAGAAKQQPTVRKALKPADKTLSMVSAVADRTRGGPVPVQVKFELKARPEPAQPLDVDIAIVPVSGAVDRVTGKVEGEDGLELLDGAQIPTAERPAEGVAIEHTVRVLPKRDGIFTLSASLTVDAAGQTTSATFAIPVIAGAGMPELQAKPAGTAAGSAAGPRGTKPAPAAATQ